MASRIQNSKARGYAAEREIAERSKLWPLRFQLTRTGLDGGHDLRGIGIVGEVKAVRTGPVWLKDGLRQLDNSPDKQHLLFVKLSQGAGHRTRWLVVQDLDQFEDYIEEMTS